MNVNNGEEEGFVREWTPCNYIVNSIPLRVQTGIFSTEISLTCIDVINEFIALGTNVGLVYWYNRKKGNIQKLRCEVSTSAITYIKIVNTVDFMVGAGNAAGQVTVFQIPKEHPESVPETLKPKVEPKVERYTIGDLHKSQITAIEWSKNGMKLFSGDKDGIIIMTEIDFYMHLCKSLEIVNEEHEIVQISYHQNSLLVSSVYRTILCEKKDNVWHISQVGKKERKSFCSFGAVFQWSYAQGGGKSASIYCARPGLRLWRADKSGEVQQTLLFREAVNNPLTIAELLNPSQSKHSHSEKEYNFGPMYIFQEHFIVTHNEEIVYILDPRSLTAVAVIDDLRRILSVSVNKDEIFVLEGSRSIVRLGHSPEPGSLATDTFKLMTKSLTTSIQQAVNTVRDFTHIDQTIPFITSVLEQPISMYFEENNVEMAQLAAEECFELPPIKSLPVDMAENVLESIINEFKDVHSDVNETRKVKTEELQTKFKLYSSIMEKACDTELIHSSKRCSRKKDSSSENSTPRTCTPIRKVSQKITNRTENGISYTSPCLMALSMYSSVEIRDNDEVLKQEIEEKEKILAKMLDLESLSLTNTSIQLDDIGNSCNEPQNNISEKPVAKSVIQNNKMTIHHSNQNVNSEQISKEVESNNLPGITKIPLNWNLNKISITKYSQSPDDHIDNEWEFI